MGVRFLQCFSAGIISILSFTSLSYAQQNLTLPQPLITLPPEWEQGRPTHAHIPSADQRLPSYR
jgi:hypothetical protein